MNMKSAETDPTVKFRFLLAVLLIVAILFGAVYGTYAWLAYQSEMKGISGVMTPNPYYLKGPKGKPSEPLFIPRIDIENKTSKTKELFFFSVVGKGEYKIQLGYTTNVPYSYSLYRLTPAKDSGALTCEYGDETLYFNYHPDYADSSSSPDGNLLVPLLNDSNGDRIADVDKYYHSTYETGDVVQENARPIYRQSADMRNAAEDSYTGYYVLVIDYSNVDKATYNEEVDIICIVAGEGSHR